LLPFLEKLVDVDDVRPIIAAEFGARINVADSSLVRLQSIYKNIDPLINPT